MAVLLGITYQKKLGLPNYSSHSCSVSLTVEIPDVNAAGKETEKLYQLLQAAVDQEIQTVGYMPDATTYGMNNRPAANGNGSHANGSGSNGNRPAPARNGDAWRCTEAQQRLILKTISESKLNKNDVENMAIDLFGVGVKELDKMQASQLIGELLEKTGKGKKPRWENRQPARA